MKAYQYSTKTLTEQGNQFKEIFLENMVEEKQITKKQRDKMNYYCFVVAEKGFFGKLWDKILFKDEDKSIITVVKILK